MPKTKLICTIGPATNTYEKLKELKEAGMNIARLNFSHGSYDSHAEVLSTLKRINEESIFPIGILLDTKGPEIRTGDVDTPLDLKMGDTVTVTVKEGYQSEYPTIFVNYVDLITSLNVDDKITLDSGLVNLKVLSKDESSLKCEVLDGGVIKSRRHVNLPGIRVNLPGITDRDREDIIFGLKHDIDFIALSFVRDVEDVKQLKELLKSQGKIGKVKIIAKIEEQEGLRNLEEIAKEVDAIMVARGDLGIEIPMEEIPNVQRNIVRTCAKHGKRVIVATQMLESMIENPIPTRAEVTDVSNAVYQEADAIMLSGETSVGKYPIRTVAQMSKIARITESYPGMGLWGDTVCINKRQHIASAAVQLAEDLKVKGMVVLTESGTTAEYISNCRPTTSKIYAFTFVEKTFQILTLYRGVIPFKMKYYNNPEEALREALRVLKDNEGFQSGEEVVVYSDMLAGNKAVDTIRIYPFQ